MKDAILYRYDNHCDVVLLNTFPVIRLTPKGAWVMDGCKKRFVLAVAHKKFAHSTKEDAKTSFLARKTRQLSILRSRIEEVEGAVSAMAEGRVADYVNSMYQFE